MDDAVADRGNGTLEAGEDCGEVDGVDLKLVEGRERLGELGVANGRVADFLGGVLVGKRGIAKRSGLA